MKKILILILVFIFLVSNVSAYHIFYYHNDHLGNPVAITNEQGDVVWEADYEPFGEIFNEENIEISNKYNYNSKELDKNTNLLYYGNRFYDSNIGRFTTADTVKGSLGAPQSLNRYVYTLNNPLKYIDLRGNQGGTTDRSGYDSVLNKLTTEDVLDREWYKKMIPAAVSYGIDPYYYTAVTIQELGGIRKEGCYQNDQTDFNWGFQNPGIFGVMKGYGAGAVLLGDAVYSGNIFNRRLLSGEDGDYFQIELTDAAKRVSWTTKQEEIININLKKMRVRPDSGWMYQGKEEAFDPNSPLNIISFTLLQGHYYTRISPAISRIGPEAAFQLLNPGERGYGEATMQTIKSIMESPNLEWLNNEIIKAGIESGVYKVSLEVIRPPMD